MSDLLKINVNEHTEKKGGLTYLSWAWAWAEVLKVDPRATWVVHQYGAPGDVQPCMWIGETAMVHTTVTVNGVARECLLPVMDNRNNAVKKPDARKISDAIMRCMTKAIAMHGLGLYIYAGEDLPEGEETAAEAADADQPNSLTAQLKASLAKGNLKPMSGAGDGVSDERKAEIDEIALHLLDCHRTGKDMEAVRIWYADDTFADNDERKYCWSLLQVESKLRSTIKANNPHKEPA